jgi:hypothetical protein
VSASNDGKPVIRLGVTFDVIDAILVVVFVTLTIRLGG